MASQVLARKWRPQNFATMVGQDHIVRALSNALDQGRLHHAYLFSGTRGVGKTTSARIFAKCLNCEEGIRAEPCGQCSTCREIAEGRCVDLIEIDAASRTRVEDMRELLEAVQYRPARARFKVYLIDEVHMLSTSSFNALLKTLEEPPDHVKFLLATTDPQKLPVTVLSRCLQFNLKRMTPERIVGQLREILAAESIPFEDAALWMLARAADGSMRDALSLTDQAIAFGDRQITAAQIRDMLGTVDQQHVRALLEVILRGDRHAVLRQIHELAEFSPDFSDVLQSLSEILHEVAVEQLVSGAARHPEEATEWPASMLATLQPESTIQLYYQIALLSRRDLALAPDARIGFEMAVLRMLALTPLAAPPFTQPTPHTPPENPPLADPTPPVMDDSAALRDKPSLMPSAAVAPSAAAATPAAVAPSTSVTPPAAVAATDSAASSDSARASAPTSADERFSDSDAVAKQVRGLPSDSDQPRAAPPLVQIKRHVPEPHHSADGQESATLVPPTATATATATATVAVAATATATATDAGQPAAALDPYRAENWEDWVAEVPARGLLKALLFHTVLANLDEQEAHLLAEPEQEAIFSRAQLPQLEQAFSELLQRAVRVTIDFQPLDAATPQQRMEERSRSRQARAEALIDQDPNVDWLLSSLDGKIVPGTLQVPGQKGR